VDGLLVDGLLTVRLVDQLSHSTLRLVLGAKIEN
jgi:hypothetical protein